MCNDRQIIVCRPRNNAYEVKLDGSEGHFTSLLTQTHRGASVLTSFQVSFPAWIRPFRWCAAICTLRKATCTGLARCLWVNN